LLLTREGGKGNPLQTGLCSAASIQQQQLWWVFVGVFIQLEKK